jgi:antitoxin VapB
MPIQIANPVVVAKIERLANETGLTKTAAVEKAVDTLLSDKDSRRDDLRRRVKALVAEIENIPDRADAFDPLEWDENGLPI